MAEHPILFSTEMVRAILDSRKTQTRRIIKPQPEYEKSQDMYWWKGDWDTRGGPRAGVCTHGSPGNGEATWTIEEITEHCPCGQVGDTLWVRESFQIEQYTFRRNCVGGKYLADNKEFWTEVYQREYDLIKNRKFPLRATSGRFMYKSLARIFLEITNIRVEQNQDIDAVEAEAEGMRRPKRLCPDRHDEYILERYQRLWDYLNSKRGYSWDKNPWVWVIEFKRTERK